MDQHHQISRNSNGSLASSSNGNSPGNADSRSTQFHTAHEQPGNASRSCSSGMEKSINGPPQPSPELGSLSLPTPLADNARSDSTVPDPTPDSMPSWLANPTGNGASMNLLGSNSESNAAESDEEAEHESSALQESVNRLPMGSDPEMRCAPSSPRMHSSDEWYFNYPSDEVPPMMESDGYGPRTSQLDVQYAQALDTYGEDSRMVLPESLNADNYTSSEITPPEAFNDRVVDAAQTGSAPYQPSPHPSEVYVRSIPLPGEAGPPSPPATSSTYSVERFLRRADDGRGTNFRRFAAAIENRGWQIGDLRNVGIEQLQGLGMSELEASMLSGLVHGYYFGRFDGRWGA